MMQKYFMLTAHAEVSNGGGTGSVAKQYQRETVGPKMATEAQQKALNRARARGNQEEVNAVMRDIFVNGTRKKRA